MTKLQLSVAMGDYDRTRALLDGTVQIDGVDPVYMTLSPEETFFRAFRSAEFDISELSFSSYLIKASKGESPYVAVPAFLSRAFRHTSIYVRKDRIKKPEDTRAAVSASRSTNSPPTSGRARSCRTTSAYAPKT